MHLSCKCASEFAPEGQLRLQLAPFLRTSRRESARSCVTSQVHEAILWAIFAPAGHRLNVFLRRRAPADLRDRHCQGQDQFSEGGIGFMRVKMDIALRKRTLIPVRHVLESSLV